MDTNLTQAYLAQRAAASHAVAGALAPKSATSTSTSTARSVSNAAATGTAATSAATSTSTITSNDFLTLLVNELKNQDPTQPTDPNQYITQLAQVNSLEQLIQINSGISQLDSSVPSTTTPAPTPTPTPAASGTQPATSGGAAPVASGPSLPLAFTSSAASQIHRPS